jgi:uncharacterized protein YcgI (DUF1989 family)
MKSEQVFMIPPRSAKCFVVKKDETIRITDINGKQPGDLVAFNLEDLSERFSQARTRVENRKSRVTENDTLWTNDNPPRVIFTITGDTYGAHDLLYTPCCRYALTKRFGVDRDGCLENLAKAVEDWGIEEREIPTPLNIFFNVEAHPSGEIVIGEQTSAPGDYLELRAEMDSLVAISTCSAPSAKGEHAPYKIEIF